MRYQYAPPATPCRYCGHVAERSSDEDCPERWRNRLMRALAGMLEYLERVWP